MDIFLGGIILGLDAISQLVLVVVGIRIAIKLEFLDIVRMVITTK